jgi:hypothetical protein
MAATATECGTFRDRQYQLELGNLAVVEWSRGRLVFGDWYVTVADNAGFRGGWVQCENLDLEGVCWQNEAKDGCLE